MVASPNFINDIEILLPAKIQNNEQYTLYYCFTIKLQCARVSEYFEMVISYDGVTQQYNKPVSELGNIDTKHISTVILDKQTYSYHYQNSIVNYRLDEAYPIISKPLQKILNLSFDDKPTENKYIRTKRMIQGFCQNYIQHDKLVFGKLMSFRSEKEFINSVQNFKSSYRYSRWDDKGWDHIRFFQDYPENKFINSELNDKLIDLSKSINQMHSDIAGFIFTTNEHNREFEEPDKTYSKEESEQIQQTQLFGIRKLPYPDKGSDEEIRAYYDRCDTEIHTTIYACENVIEKYLDFRTAVKRILVI